MRIALVKGTVTATAKDAALIGSTLLIVDIIDEKEKVIDSAVVAINTVGAGVGDKVLVVQGSSARMPSSAASVPVDATIIAVVDAVSVASSS